MNNLLLDMMQIQGVENAAITGAIDKSSVSQLLENNSDDILEQTFPNALQAMLSEMLPTDKQQLSNLESSLGQTSVIQGNDVTQDTQPALIGLSENDNQLNVSKELTVESFFNVKDNLQPIHLKGEIKALIPEQVTQLTKEAIVPGQEAQIIKSAPVSNLEAQYSNVNSNDKLTAYNFVTEINGISNNLKLLLPQINVESSINQQPLQGYLISNDDSGVVNDNSSLTLENNKHEIILPVQVSVKQGMIPIENNISELKITDKLALTDKNDNKQQFIPNDVRENILKAVVTVDQKAIVEQLNKSLQPKTEILTAEFKNNPVSQVLISNQPRLNIKVSNKNILNQAEQINSNNKESDDNLLTRKVDKSNTSTNNSLTNNEQKADFALNKNVKVTDQSASNIKLFDHFSEINHTVKSEQVKDISPQRIIPQQRLNTSGVEDFNWDKFKINFNRFNYNQLRNTGEIRLSLHPAHLGSLKVSLTSNVEEVVARFELSSESARQVVEQNLPQLRESLEKAGIKVDTLEVVVSDQQRRHHRQPHYSRQDHKPKNMKTENKTTRQINRIINSTQLLSGAVGLNVLA